MYVAHTGQVCFHSSLLGHELELITEEASRVGGNAIGSVASLWGEVKKWPILWWKRVRYVACTFCRIFASNKYGLLRLSETSGVLKCRKCLQLRRSGDCYPYTLVIFCSRLENPQSLFSLGRYPWYHEEWCIFPRRILSKGLGPGMFPWRAGTGMEAEACFGWKGLEDWNR